MGSSALVDNMWVFNGVRERRFPGPGTAQFLHNLSHSFISSKGRFSTFSTRPLFLYNLVFSIHSSPRGIWGQDPGSFRGLAQPWNLSSARMTFCENCNF